MMQASELCVPLSTLALPGDTEGAKETPAAGDPVEMQVTGTVTRVDGENAYITPESVNGEPLTASEPAAPAEMGEDDLRTMATAQDDETFS